MMGVEAGIISILAIIALIYLGVHVPIALGVVSFVGVWVLRDNFDVATRLLSLAAKESITAYVFGVIPLFVLMGLLVSVSDVGRDAYQVAQLLFRKIRGGLGMATVAANAVFAAITGISIASAAVFTRISVPEMLRYGYGPRFAVGVVAGSSVLGMLIPPSILLIVFALTTEQSVGALFTAGIIPGLLLALAYMVAIAVMARGFPGYVGGPGTRLAAEMLDKLGQMPSEVERLTGWQILVKLGPTLALIGLVLGGIYAGLFTPTEAGAVGALGVLVIAVAQRRLTWKSFWSVLIETGQISAAILFLVVTASMYSRMLGVSGLPTQLGNWIGSAELSFAWIMLVYVLVVLVLGTIMDAVSIILITVPLFLPVLEPYDVNLIWFGIVTVIAVEIGLLTPPLGVSCFVIKASLQDERISLFDVFAGAAPFALIMLLVLITVILLPGLSLVLL
jgi:tripartite ATP-independent transporter DctM subunit